MFFCCVDLTLLPTSESFILVNILTTRQKRQQRSPHCVCVFLWPCLRVVLCSERWLLSALPVCNEHPDESWGRAARVGSEPAPFLPDQVKWDETHLPVLLFTVIYCFLRVTRTLFLLVRHIIENGRLIVCWKDSIFSFAAELCCETSFYHPSPRSTLLPSVSASAFRWQLLWKAPFVQIWEQFSRILTTVTSRSHLGKLPFDPFGDASMTNTKQKCCNDASALICTYNGDVIMLSEVRVGVLWTAPLHVHLGTEKNVLKDHMWSSGISLSLAHVIIEILEYGQVTGWVKPLTGCVTFKIKENQSAAVCHSSLFNKTWIDCLEFLSFDQ